MGLIKLNSSERKLFTDVEHGDRTKLAISDDPISAEVLRHIVLGLPLAERLLWAVPREGICRTTGAGISLLNATIDGPLRLNAAIGCHGGPLCPLEFVNCTFKAGFHAPHAHFSRLSLRDCIFEDPGERTETGACLPVIDLTGARLDSHLDMAVVRPGGGNESPLWIRAVGVCVGGGINLAKSRLRAPYKPAVQLPDGKTAPREREDALDLTLADIAGDLSLDDGMSVQGRLKLRGTKVGGDMWLDTAALAEPGEDGVALLMQGACIRGFLSMCYPDRPREQVDSGGHINLVASEIGRSLIFKQVRMAGDLKADDLIVRDDFTLHVRIAGQVDLVRASIGGSLDISELQFESPGGSGRRSSDDEEGALSLKDGKIGGALRLTTKRKGASPLQLAGVINLEGLTCDTLDDDVGRRWGRDVVIRMNHFTYRRTGWLARRSPGARNAPARRSIYRFIGDWNRERHDRRIWPWHWFPKTRPMRRDAADPERRQPSYRIVSNWIQSRKADGRFPWRLMPAWTLSDDEDYCKPWQHRRNWIYQQYGRDGDHDPYVSLIRRRIKEADYHPQPFEQAIKVARAEGREEFATQFEMHKQYLEWRFFNEHVRWGLGLAGIALAALWLVIGGRIDVPRLLWTGLACSVTILLMVFGSGLRDMLRRHLFLPALLKKRRALNRLVALTMGLLLGLAIASGTPYRILLGIAAVSAAILLISIGCLFAARWAARPRPRARADWAAWWSSKFLTWLIYWVPAAVLFVADWQERPFRFLIAMLIFLVIRWLAAIAHQLMRFGFGYLRQPIRAVVTLIFAFLIGWRGANVANSHKMFVVAAQPVASLVGEDRSTGETAAEGASNTPESEDEDHSKPRQLMGSELVETMNFAADAESTPTPPKPAAVAAQGPRQGIRDVSCAHEISEPLYALDVLVPIVDLGEETRCEIRRFPAREHPVVETEKLKPRELWVQRGDWPLNDHRFWWWMKAVYAIAGWILVSLALLTFAQVNRTHGEPAE
jgi:hypothetical protein